MWVDRLFIFNASKPEQTLHVPAGPHLAAGHDGHLAGLDRQHQQPAHDERGLQSRRAAGHGASAGARDARRRRTRQQAVQRLRRQRAADASSSAKPDTRVHAAGAQGRRRFGRRCSARSTASTSTSACSARSGCCTSTRSSAASRSRRSRSRRARRTRATGRRPKPERRTWRCSSCKAAQPDHLKDAPGGAAVPGDGRGRARARQGRSSPRPARAATRARCRRCAAGLDPARLRRARATSTAASATGTGPRPTSSRRQMRAIVHAPDFLDGQLPVDRAARPGDAAAHQRLQSAGDQRARRQHLGQLLVAVLQGPAVGRHRSRCTIRSPASRCQYAMPAGGRGYTRVPSLISLWSTAPFLLNNSVGSRSSSDPVGRGAHAGVRGLDRADAVAGEARSATRCWATRSRAATIDRTTAAQLHHASRPASCPRRCGRCRARCTADPAVAGRRPDGDVALGPIPKGVPVNLLVQPAAAAGERRPERASCGMSGSGRSCWSS